ncbi:MAG: hypothetical protein E6F99_03255 [Actinobacteria bacterium]|nr:MAG: hypothetical protein E6F99_03255 [Actinomycetota bacterium]
MVGIVAPGVAALLFKVLSVPSVLALLGAGQAKSGTSLEFLAWGGYATVAANNIIFRQSRTPEPLLSRVNTSGRILASGAGTSLGALIGGAVADAAGVGWAIATGAGFAALSALIGWLSPLRREPLRAA